jgi:hypothetical protein
MSERNIYLYWVGKEYKLISILRNLIYLHSTNGIGYKVHLITDKNINDYIQNIPTYFSNLCPSHQADFVRVNIICDYGGIWLDSDTIVMDSLDSLFDLIDTKDGFFIKENNELLCNGIFGSKANTPLMIKWKENMINILDEKKDQIGWTEIGIFILMSIYAKNTNLYDNYTIFNGLDNLYPVNWNNCVNEYINKPYDNYKQIIREYQPLVVLVNSVYKILEDKTVKEILECNLPLNYFINKSFENMKLIDYDFIEIGASNFDTLIESSDDNTFNNSVDIVSYYIDNLPIWFKECNTINNFHPLRKINKVKIITTYELLYQNNVRNIKYLKIDAKGHDIIILKSLLSYINNLPICFYPNKILFRTNENLNSIEVDEIIHLYCSIGYNLENSGYDSILVFTSI